ncbi:MAG: divalent-cation tolerance protein CutA [Planctomycetota bacterium]
MTPPSERPADRAAAPGDVVVALCTAPASAAEDLARAVVGERLCACVNALPGVVSHFVWDGRVDRAEEVLLVIKTTRAALPRLQARLVDLHPYDVPEVLVLEARDGHEPYLQWVRDSVADAGAGTPAPGIRDAGSPGVDLAGGAAE